MKCIDLGEPERMVGLADWLRGSGTAAERERVPAVDPAVEIERERVRIFEEARERGYLDGAKRADAAIAEAEADARRRVVAANEAEALRLNTERDRFVALASAVPAILKTQEATILDAAVEIALVAMTRLLAIRPVDGGALAALCRQVLDESRHRPATLKVSPDDEALIRRYCEMDGVMIVADVRVSSGSCELQSAAGTVATGIDDRLAGLRDALLSATPAIAPTEMRAP